MYPVYNKFYYKPLPDCITILKSKIEGLGLFATEDIKQDFNLGVSHIKVPVICGFIRTSIGGFLNHNENSNCELVLELDWDDYKVYNVFTTKKIGQGEELTLNYHIDELNYGEK
jgi:SET domain-containing protein|tara:strand:+ start:363 stop:704 length:342 start_codon:yes stop_codon:yes gene_type:complete